MYIDECFSKGSFQSHQMKKKIIAYYISLSELSN